MTTKYCYYKSSLCRWVPSYRDTRRKKFCRCRLFKVTGRLIGMVNDMAVSRGRKRANILTVVFLGARLGTVNGMPLTFIWRNSKNDGNGNFQEVLDITRIKIGILKGESSGSLDLNERDIEGLKAVQTNELVVSGQNIISSQREG